MNVTIANDICNTISLLRSKIYTNEMFKDIFKENIESSVGALSVNYAPDKEGGLIVNADIDINKCSDIPDMKSDKFIGNIRNSLQNTISKVDDSYLSSMDGNNASNLFNVIITGPNSIAIKL
jgi:hypothetical protein